MFRLLLGLDSAPRPYDASDALAIAICHLHSAPPAAVRARVRPVMRGTPRNWRSFDPAAHAARAKRPH